MKPTQTVSITKKGVDEVVNRTHRLALRKRSVLILLERPQTFKFILEKAVLDQDSLIAEIMALAADGFLKLDEPVAGGVPAPQMKELAATSALATSTGNSVGGSSIVNDEIILSEARFLMVNFCVNVFGTKSQSYVDSLTQCSNVGQFASCTKKIYEIMKLSYPDKLKDFQAVITEINQTAL